MNLLVLDLQLITGLLEPIFDPVDLMLQLLLDMQKLLFHFSNSFLQFCDFDMMLGLFLVVFHLEVFFVLN